MLSSMCCCWCVCCRRSGAAGLEDGTLPFTAIAAARHGFSQLQRLGGLPAISRHTACLTWHLMQQLVQLQHSNGQPVAVLYCAPAVRQLLLNHRADWQHSQGPSSSSNSSSSSCSCSNNCVVPEPSVLACFREHQGPVVCFNLLRPDGSWVGHKEVAKLAAICNICLRTGMRCWSAPCLGLKGAPAQQGVSIKPSRLAGPNMLSWHRLGCARCSGNHSNRPWFVTLTVYGACKSPTHAEPIPGSLLLCLQAASATQVPVPTTWASPAVICCPTMQQDMCAGTTRT